VRVLWLLPKVAPALLRHLAAYIELIGYDLARTQREIAASIVAFVIVAVSLFFALLMGCVAVIALTWDTPHRVLAIVCMGGAFLGLAIIALIYRSNVLREQGPFLASVRQQWQEDCVTLEGILSEEHEH
jgi:uncharacterized membrane protein YqjE